MLSILARGCPNGLFDDKNHDNDGVNVRDINTEDDTVVMMMMMMMMVMTMMIGAVWSFTDICTHPPDIFH